MRRGLRRRGGALVADDFDDPLLGVVNLFDIAMVFAVALVVALVFATASPTVLTGERNAAEVPDPGSTPNAPAAGGEPVGRVLRLPDGRLVYTIDEGGR